MAQGDGLPTLHTWNVGATIYVDIVNGNDTTGTGATGLPYQTLQKVADVLKNTYTWPTNQDVKVAIRAGTYKAANTAGNTMQTSFSSTTRAPNASRYLIWAPDTGSEGLVIVKNPDGTTGTTKGGFRIGGTGALDSFQIVYGIEFDGEGVAKGVAGDGNCYGIWFSGSASDCEIISCHIHSFVGNAGPHAPAQGIETSPGDNIRMRVYDCTIHDIGSSGGVTNLFQEHGVYISGSDSWCSNNRIYNIINGYALHYYDANNRSMNRSIATNNTLDNNYAAAILIHGDSTSCTFANNIFSNHIGRGANSFGIQFTPNGTGLGAANLVDSNLYFNNFAGNRDESPTGWTFSNEGSGNPLYASATISVTGDHHLTAGSPAINFANTTYSPATDIEGTTRPAGAEDVGAYEFSAGASGSAGGSSAIVGSFGTITRINS